MPLQATSGAASYDGFGGGVVAEPVYIEQIFSTYLYTGTGSSQTITNGIDLSTKGGLVWVKSRSNAKNNCLVDTIRGVSKALASNTTGAQDFSDGQYVNDFSTTGFGVGSVGDVGGAAGITFGTWTFREQPKFFDVVTYTGNGVQGRAIPHNLGSVPGCIIVKRTNASASWYVYHRAVDATSPQNYVLLLDQTLARISSSDPWDNTAPTSTNFTVGSNSNYNGSGDTYVAYLFAHDAGGFGLTGTDNVISCGSFTGSTSGTTVNLGWEPQWVLIKRSSGNTDNWRIYDNMRGMTASNGGQLLYADTSGSETTNSRISVNATGFGFVDDDAYGNIYIAIRRGPMKVPTSGTSVFSPNAVSTDASAVTTNFPVDFFFDTQRTASGVGTIVGSRLQGNKNLVTNSTSAEAAYITNAAWSQSNTSITPNIFGPSTPGPVLWNFQRAPSFFDEVCYTASGSSIKNHNLGVAPEFIITKSRDLAQNWIVTANLGANGKQFTSINTSAATYSDNFSSYATSTTIDTSVFAFNDVGYNYVAYLFATCAGVSKVGSYTGNGSTQTINCGFTGGARFVMVKATSTTGNWIVADSARGIVAGNDPALYLNSTAAEVTGLDWIDADNSGFVVNETATIAANTNGVSYIFFAVA